MIQSAYLPHSVHRLQIARSLVTVTVRKEPKEALFFLA
jgi:hypothetical protein